MGFVFLGILISANLALLLAYDLGDTVFDSFVESSNQRCGGGWNCNEFECEFQKIWRLNGRTESSKDYFVFYWVSTILNLQDFPQELPKHVDNRLV